MMWRWFVIIFGCSSAFILIAMVAVDGVLIGPPTYPNPRLFPFNRTDWCSLATKVFVDSNASAESFLNGLTIRAAINADSPKFSVVFDKSTEPWKPVGGLMISMAQQLEALGGFTFDYVVTPPIKTSVTQYYLDILPYVDLFIGRAYPDTIERRSAGIGFTQNIADASLVLFTIVTTSGTDEFDLWNFLRPFDNNLWAAILGVIMVTFFGRLITDWFQEQNKIKLQSALGRDMGEDEYSVVRYVYKAVGQFVNSRETVDEPRNIGTKILNTGYSFFILIILAAYTANLASILIQVPTNTTPFKDISECNTNRGSVCVLAGTAAAAVVQNDYPSIRVVNIHSIDATDVFRAVLDPEAPCIGGVVYQYEFDSRRDFVAANPSCNLAVVGGAFQPFNGAWAYAIDYVDKCTSVIELGISSLIVGLRETGQYQAIYQAALDEFADESCPFPQFDPAPASALTVYKMAGIFVVFAGALVAGLALGIVSYIYSDVMMWCKATSGNSETSVHNGPLQAGGGGAGVGTGSSVLSTKASWNVRSLWDGCFTAVGKRSHETGTSEASTNTPRGSDHTMVLEGTTPSRKSPWELRGFWDGAVGLVIRKSPRQADNSDGETTRDTPL